MGPKPALKPREHRGFTIELGHSGAAVMPRAAWGGTTQAACSRRWDKRIRKRTTTSTTR